MKNDIQELSNNMKAMRDLNEKIFQCFKEMNLTVEEMAEHMKDMQGLQRGSIRDVALSNGDKVMEGKINAADKIVKQNKIAAFKKAVAEGTQEEFLSQMSWSEKFSLKDGMNLIKHGFEGETPFTSEEGIYYNILEESMNKYFKKEALSEEFEDELTKKGRNR